MLVIPPGLSEEEEALQKKFNKLKKKVRELVGGAVHGATFHRFFTLRTPGMSVKGQGFLWVHTWRGIICVVSRGGGSRVLM